MKHILNLFKRKPSTLTASLMSQIIYQGEHGWHDAKWSER